MTNLAHKHSANQTAIASARDVDAAMAAMRAHTADANVQRNGCYAVAKIQEATVRAQAGAVGKRGEVARYDDVCNLRLYHNIQLQVCMQRVASLRKKRSLQHDGGARRAVSLVTARDLADATVVVDRSSACIDCDGVELDIRRT
eukprot:COSAG01_NODE_27482_length_684_cov_5.377778_2_plen_144_part_00